VYSCKYHVIRTTPSTKAMRDGPLESMFPVASSKILDFLSTYKTWDYSVSDIAKYAGVSFKTALNEVRKLEEEGIINRTRTVGKAIMFQWNPASAQAKSIGKLAFEIAKKRIHRSIES